MGNLRSRGHIRVLPVAFDRLDMEQLAWSQCVFFLAVTHRLKCNMTYQGHDVSLTRDQILTFTFQGQNAYVATRVDKRNTMTFELFRLIS